MGQGTTLKGCRCQMRGKSRTGLLLLLLLLSNPHSALDDFVQPTIQPNHQQTARSFVIHTYPRVTTPSKTAATRVGAATMSAHPSLVEWKKLRFLIMDAPKANNLHLYLRELKKHNVVCVVRVCEPTYPASEVEAAGMKVRNWRRGTLSFRPRFESIASTAGMHVLYICSLRLPFTYHMLFDVLRLLLSRARSPA